MTSARSTRRGFLARLAGVCGAAIAAPLVWRSGGQRTVKSPEVEILGCTGVAVWDSAQGGYRVLAFDPRYRYFRLVPDDSGLIVRVEPIREPADEVDINHDGHHHTLCFNTVSANTIYPPQ